MGVLVNPFWASAAPFVPTDIANCILWLDASNRGVTTNTWDDLSGTGNHFTSSSAAKFPTFSGGAATFDGTDDEVGGPVGMISSAAGEIFLRMKRYADNGDTGNNTGWMAWGTDSNQDHFTYGSTIYTHFGSTARKTVGNPSWDTSTFSTINIWSAASDWAFNRNGTLEYSTASNTVSWLLSPSTFHIGWSFSTYYFQGDIKSVVLFNRKLSASERTDMETYMSTI